MEACADEERYVVRVPCVQDTISKIMMSRKISVPSNKKPFASECHVDTSYGHILLLRATLPLHGHIPVRLVHKERQH